MLCEPNFSLPQHIDLNQLRKSDKPYFAAHEKELKSQSAKQFLTQVQTDYVVLPTFSNQNDHLKSVLSLKENEYMICRWQQFLNKTPERYVHIYLYVDFRKPKQVIRKMQLTGAFYGVDNKLAPIPYLPDPRKFDKTSFEKHSHGTQLNKLNKLI